MAGSYRDTLLVLLLRGCAATAAAVLVVILLFVARESSIALHELPVHRWFQDERWSPLSGQYNLVSMLVASLLVTAGSFLVTAPLGIGSAVFLHFYAPTWLASIYRRIIEILAGIPSVVYGLWGLTMLVPWIATFSPIGQGQSLLAGVLVLSIMTLPMIVVAADSGLATVPLEQIQGAAALGLPRRAIAWSVAVPSASASLMSGMVLQIGRAIGETMAVLMVCGNIVQLPGSVFQPVRTLTANIALEMGYATPLHRSALFVTGLILLLLVMTAMLLAELLLSGRRSTVSSEPLR